MVCLNDHYIEGVKKVMLDIKSHFTKETLLVPAPSQQDSGRIRLPWAITKVRGCRLAGRQKVIWSATSSDADRIANMPTDDAHLVLTNKGGSNQLEFVTIQLSMINDFVVR